MRAIKYPGSYSKSAVLLSCLALVLIIAFIRYKTGPELALSLLYLFPIAIVAWNAGRWPGIFMCCASAASWLLADLTMLDKFSRPFIPYINETFRLIVFIIIANIMVALRDALEKQAELARTDALTGISNRRSFMEFVELELNKARRFNYPVSMMYLDIDDFKTVNDQAGHHTGDSLLSLVARTLKTNIRAIDVVARLGGDEFGVMMSGAGKDASFSVAGKIHEKLLTMVKENNWHVTFSIGLAVFETPPDSVYEMVKKADSLMYAAKQNGKNMIKCELVAQTPPSV